MISVTPSASAQESFHNQPDREISQINGVCKGQTLFLIQAGIAFGYVIMYNYSVIRFLRQPFPLRYDLAYDLKIAGFIGLFVFFVFVVFQPFGLSRVAPHLKNYLIAGYSLTTFVTMLLNLLIIPRVLKKVFIEETWTVYKRILWQIWLVFAVGTGCYLFACVFDMIFDFYRLGFGLFLYIQSIAVFIAVIPIIVINVFGQNYLLRKNLRMAEEVSARLKDSLRVSDLQPEPSRKVVLTSENEKERYELAADDILYIISEGNYAKVIVAKKNTENILIRSSLTRLEKQLADYPFLFRCHRAYIVNIRKINKSSGNAQGLKLSLENVEKPIPVARNFTRKFKQLMGIS